MKKIIMVENLEKELLEGEHQTLINQLETIVDAKHIAEVKRVIAYLTKINSFRMEILHTLDIEQVHKKITHYLYDEFGIDTFSITHKVNTIETVTFSKGNIKECSHNFYYIIGDLGGVSFALDSNNLDHFGSVYLNTFLDEITNILYIKYVLRELQESAYLDHLTKLKNRQSFEEDMREFIPLALREKMSLAVLIINIDRFRAVNDEHGTQFGDEFLKLYASVIKENIRSSDIAVRFGGGEFLVLLINVLDEQKVIEIAQKIQDALADAFLLSPNNDHFKKTVCIGISMFPDDSNDINEVIKKAEMALTDAKDKGRNTILRFKEIQESEIDLF